LIEEWVMDDERKETKKFTGNHPEIIEEYFNL
jgi:hypothetical protein